MQGPRTASGGSVPSRRTAAALLAVLVPAAGCQSGPGERVVVNGTVLSRYRARGIDRAAYGALGLRDLDADGSVPPDWSLYYQDPYTEYTGAVHVDDAGRIRRVNLTLERSAGEESVPTTVRVRARPDVTDARVGARWVERTPRLRVRVLGVGGAAVAVEHRGGPAATASGAVEAGNETSRTLFPLLTTRALRPGGTLYV